MFVHWRDVRDAETWEVRETRLGERNAITFISDDGRRMHTTANPFDRPPSKLTDEELETLLDRARDG
jgi:hypothetical protein